MTRPASLARLRADVADQADIAGAVGTGQRYTPSLLNRLINESINRFRERVSNEANHYLTSSSGTLTAGATGDYPFLVLTVPTAAVRTYGLDINVDGIVRSLHYVPFNDRDKYGGPLATGEPQAWTHFSTREIAILPPPNESYSYVLWYLPVATDLSSDSDQFEGVSGWEDYIVWDVVCRVIVRDQFPQAYQMAVTFRGDVWADILRAATKVSHAGGGRHGRDTMGERLRGISATRRLPPP